MPKAVIPKKCGLCRPLLDGKRLPVVPMDQKYAAVGIVAKFFNPASAPKIEDCSFDLLQLVFEALLERPK
jgi:hypothetical protein